MIGVIFERHFKRHGEAIKSFRERIAADGEVCFAWSIGRVAVLRLERAIR